MSATFRLRLLAWLRPSALQRRIFAAVLIGVLGALATLGYRTFLEQMERLLYGTQAGMSQVAANLPYWVRIVIPTLGGLGAGLVLHYSARFLAQHRTSDYMEAISLGDGVMPVRLSLLRALSSSFSIVSGGSIGREGSMIQLSALVGSLLGRGRKMAEADLRMWVAYGAAAGVAAAYHAPIAGALFVSEIVLRSLSFKRLWPLLLASVSAEFFMRSLFGSPPLYRMPSDFAALSGQQILPFIGLGLLAGVGAPCFLALLSVSKRFFSHLCKALPLRLALGGFLVGLISCMSPGVWGNGYGLVSHILQEQWLGPALLLVLVSKVLATACTTGSGAVGGVFTPTLFVGAAMGALYGTLVHNLGMTSVPVAAYTVVGMGAFLAATTHAPLMSILMLFEMTESFHTLMPLSVACVLGFYIARAVRADSVYAHSLPDLPPLCRMNRGQKG